MQMNTTTQNPLDQMSSITNGAAICQTPTAGPVYGSRHTLTRMRVARMRVAARFLDRLGELLESENGNSMHVAGTCLSSIMSDVDGLICSGRNLVIDNLPKSPAGSGMAHAAIGVQLLVDSEIVERLRSTKEADTDEMIEAAEFLGKHWAENGATADELKRLEAAKDAPYANGSFDFGTGSSANSAGEQLFFVIHPECDGDRDESRAFWDDIIEGMEDVDSDSPTHAEFVNAFAAEANKVWSNVKAEVLAGD
jgi:hypothetical protein